MRQRAYELTDVGVQRGLHLAVEHLGQSEVQHFRVSVAVDEDVARLQIAMNDAALMGMVHRGHTRRHQLEPPWRGQPAGDGMSQQRLSLDELHCEMRLRSESAIIGGCDVDLSDAGGDATARALRIPVRSDAGC